MNILNSIKDVTILITPLLIVTLIFLVVKNSV